MRKYRLCLLYPCFTLLACFGTAEAQLYESNCYFPQFGKPGEIDTVYGNHAGQQLGSDVFNPGPIPGYPDGKIFIEGLPQNAPFLSAIDPKPPFDIHNFSVEKKIPFNRDNIISEFAHLHDSKHLDIIAISSARDNPRIYWSDDKGNYDSSRVTYFQIPKRKGYMRGYDNLSAGFPSVGRFVSDTVSDIILGVYYGPIDTGVLTYYLAFFNGGNNLFGKGDTAFCDSLSLIKPPYDDIYARRDIVTGNWRNRSVEDIIGISERSGDWFYFRNDPPFSLSKFWNAMQYDTLLTRWQNPTLGAEHGGIALHLFPKSQGDSSEDLLCGFQRKGNTVDDLNFFYKGGKDFGTKRIFVDSADFVFHSPRYYSSSLFGFYVNPLEYVGDLTGTGNPVMRVFADLYTSAYEFYYVMGKALNDQVDMSFRPEPNGIGWFASFDADGDGKMDVLEGMPSFATEKDISNGKQNVGLLALIHGSNKIPVNLNPKYAVKERQEVDAALWHIAAHPNPCDERTVLTFDNCTTSRMQVNIYSTTGALMSHDETPAVDGLQQFAVDLSALPPAMYVINLSCPAQGWTGSVKVVKTGAATAPWSLDLKKMVGR